MMQSTYLASSQPTNARRKHSANVSQIVKRTKHVCIFFTQLLTTDWWNAMAVRTAAHTHKRARNAHRGRCDQDSALAWRRERKCLHATIRSSDTGCFIVGAVGWFFQLFRKCKWCWFRLRSRTVLVEVFGRDSRLWPISHTESYIESIF